MTEQYKTLNTPFDLSHSLVLDDLFAPEQKECSFSVEGSTGKQWLRVEPLPKEEIRIDSNVSFSAQRDQDIFIIGQAAIPSEEEVLLSQQRLLCKNQGTVIKLDPPSPSNLYVLPVEDNLFHFKPSFFFASSHGLHYAERSKKALSDYDLARHYLFASCFGEGLLCLASSQKLIPLAVTGRFSLPMTSIVAFSQKVRLIPEVLEIGEGPADLTCAIIGNGQVWVTADALSMAEVESLYDTVSE
jgi:hypothetical protein